jgi:alcohol dehydrogenase
MKARSLLLSAPRELSWTEELLPAPKANQVLVKTEYTAVSIGTELPTYLGSSRHFHDKYPSMTGYESLGRVIALGSKVQGLKLNDRVVAFYGHRTHALVEAKRVIKVPANISDKIGLLSILSCDVAKGIRKLSLNLEDAVLVSGAGAIGLLTVFMLRAYGVNDVDVIEPKSERRALAGSLGARGVYALESTQSYDYALECSGRTVAFEQLQTLMNHDGTICVLADGHIEAYRLLPAFHSKELKIVGSSDGWNYQEHTHWFFGLEQEGLKRLEALFEVSVSAEELPKTFKAMADWHLAPIKILVSFAEG